MTLGQLIDEILKNKKDIYLDYEVLILDLTLNESFHAEDIKISEDKKKILIRAR